jgi:hypothetical protein
MPPALYRRKNINTVIDGNILMKAAKKPCPFDPK